MIVVADTSPLNYLIQIDCDNLLPRLYGQIIVPTAVLQEMRHSGAPAAVSTWLASAPPWLDVYNTVSVSNTELAFLGPGEREAILLAQEEKADLLLIDERRGRLEAKKRGLRTTGTLGVLLSAGELGWINPETTYHRLLTETTFRVSTRLEAQFLSTIRPS